MMNLVYIPRDVGNHGNAIYFMKERSMKHGAFLVTKFIAYFVTLGDLDGSY